MSLTRQRVAQLLAEGESVMGIARRLGLAVPTVAYHAERLRAPSAKQAAVPMTEVPDVRFKVRTRVLVAELLAHGFNRAEVARQLGLGKGTVSYHARRLGLPIDERGARRYDWEVVQRFYDDGHSVRECIAAFGFGHQTWQDAMRRGAIVTRPQRTPTDQLFTTGQLRNRGNLKRRLIAEGLKHPICAACGIADWRGKPLSLALHHLNGDRVDNRLENLELLCPNCHSQTETYSGRNGHRRSGS